MSYEKCVMFECARYVGVKYVSMMLSLYDDCFHRREWSTGHRCYSTRHNFLLEKWWRLLLNRIWL